MIFLQALQSMQKEKISFATFTDFSIKILGKGSKILSVSEREEKRGRRQCGYYDNGGYSKLVGYTYTGKSRHEERIHLKRTRHASTYDINESVKPSFKEYIVTLG